MAKAVFHRNQRVWVESVGTWATIEKIVPTWAKGFEEPVRVTYEVGLGREFHAHELRAEDRTDGGPENWRLLRAKNKWRQPDECAHHPHPGTVPVVVTDPNDWGGWRTPGAEYDRDPVRIERQARLIASAPRLHSIARELTRLAAESPLDLPPAVADLAAHAAAIERFLQDVPTPAGSTPRGESDAA